MKLHNLALALTVSTLAMVSTAHAQVLVQFNPSAPESNFGAPTGFTDNVAYTIAMTSDATNVYLQLATAPALGAATGYTALDFANLYFSTNVATGTGGSTLAFEIENQDAFIP